ncbi:MAG: hypothetical protein ACM3ML_29055 [Micromonosporaceae bacterium]
MTELARFDGGVPAAAAEMGIDPRTINALANGDVPAPDDMRAIYTWLIQRVTLTPQEIGDYKRLRDATSYRQKA